MVRPSSSQITPPSSPQQRRARTLSALPGSELQKAFFGGTESAPSESRRKRVRDMTLVPGSPCHAAFFGADDKLRDTFDQEAVTADYCNRRYLSRERQDSSSSLKQGRPMLPRYGEF